MTYTLAGDLMAADWLASGELDHTGNSSPYRAVGAISRHSSRDLTGGHFTGLPPALWPPYVRCQICLFPLPPRPPFNAAAEHPVCHIASVVCSTRGLPGGAKYKTGRLSSVCGDQLPCCNHVASPLLLDILSQYGKPTHHAGRLRRVEGVGVAPSREEPLFVLRL